MITLSEQELNKLKELSCENRQNVIKMVYEAQSGHIGGSLSSCDIMTVLFNKCMKHAVDGKSSPEYQSRDRFVLSKVMFRQFTIQFFLRLVLFQNLN